MPVISSSPLRVTALRVMGLLPGLGLCLVVTLAASAGEAVERGLLGKAWLEALVLAIVFGTVVRSLWSPSDVWQRGIEFGAKIPLEVAVMLLGVSVSGATLAAASPALLAGVAGVVGASILLGFAMGKLLALPTRMALLIACGTSICGNSAIAAVAPVIDADADEVAAAVAFTAVLGVGVVLGLPFLALALGWNPVAYGTFAGLTVYAVPQVIAAAAPLGPVAVQMGTLVKLLRVLLLGPVCIVLSLVAPRIWPSAANGAGSTPHRRGRTPGFTHLVPWFIVGFLALAAFRALGWVPASAIAPAGRLAGMLTVTSMAALGLGVDLRSVVRSGGRVTLSVLLALAGLGALSATLVWSLHLG